MKKCASHITAALAAALLVVTAHAEIINVSGGGDALQDAINSANDGDTLLVEPGTYWPISTANMAITIESTDGADVTFIDGGNTNRCATLGTATSQTNTVLTGFTLRNGNATYGGGSYVGTLNDCTLTNNTATYGGGAYWSTLNNCALTGNSASENGGGAYYGTLDNCILTGNSAYSGGGASDGTLNNCILSGNTATYDGGGSNDGTLNDCTLTNNTAYDGGGSYAGTLNNCTLTGNTASRSGGGSSYGTLNNCTLTNNTADQGGGSYSGTLNNCTLAGNTADYGGGSYQGALNNCTLTGNTANSGNGGGAYNGTLRNCLLTGNRASRDGGGSYYGMLVNCTLSGNTAGSRGGGACDTTLYNCIVWGNTTGSSAPNHSGGAFFYSCTEPLPDGSTNINEDPLFVDAANGDFRLQPDSPCIGKGNNDYVTLEFDLDGNPRIANGTVDMGAYEFQAPGSDSDSYLSDPDGAGVAPTATTAYDGFVYDDNNTVRGTMTLNAKMAVKKVTDKATKEVSFTTNWTFSAKAVLQNASISFSGKTEGVAERFTAATKNNAETLDVTVEGDRFYGTLSGIKVGGAFSVDGAKNGFLKKNDPDLLPLMGLYNIALLGRPVVESSGYVSLSVGNAGAVKYAGQLSDGTKISGSAKLLAGLNEDGWYAVALHKPLYSKKGFIGGLLWLDPSSSAIRVDTDNDWFVDWVCEDPKKPNFTRELDVLGGYFGTGKDTPKPPDGLKFSADVPAGLPAPVLLTGGAWVADAFPLGLEVIYGNAGKLSLAKGFAPKMPKGQTEYDYLVSSPSLATLSYTPKTGIFKGSFKLYYDGIDPKNSKLQHKTIGVSYTGVMVPDNGELKGLGTGSATINKVKHGIPVFLEK